MQRLSGKVALISGASGGIGAAVIERFTEEGATPVGCDLHPVNGEVPCDVRDADSCRAAVAEVMLRHGRLDVLCNVAGIGIANRIEDVQPDEWRQVLDVNLTGTFLLSQAALPALRESVGVIVNMASAAGIQATPYNAAYCASKAGVIQLTKSMALELSPAGIRVNAVCPASVDTPFLRGFRLPEDADLKLLMRSVSPLGQLIQPTEVAAAVAYSRLGRCRHGQRHHLGDRRWGQRLSGRAGPPHPGTRALGAFSVHPEPVSQPYRTAKPSSSTVARGLGASDPPGADATTIDTLPGQTDT